MYETLSAAGVPTELYLLYGREHLSTFWVNSPVERGIEFLDLRLRGSSSKPALTQAVR